MNAIRKQSFLNLNDAYKRTNGTAKLFQALIR